MAYTTPDAGARSRPMTAEERKVIMASSAGTIFEWYDFYLYGSLATIIGAHFQPSQLRIAQYIGRPPDEQPRSRPKQPQTEKAYIKDGMIVIEPIL